MAAAGVHIKTLGLAEKSLNSDSKILIAGSGEGVLEYQLLKRGFSADAISALDIKPEQYKLEEVQCQFCGV